MKIMKRYNGMKRSTEVTQESIEIARVMLMKKQCIAFEVSLQAGVNDLLESASLAVSINPEPVSTDRHYEPHVYKSTQDGYESDYRDSF